MSIALFKNSLKSNWLLLLIFTVISVMYLSLIIFIFDEGQLLMLNDALKAIPPAIAAAVGMETVPTVMVTFIATYFYGFLLQLFLLPHTILLPINLIAKHVDRGSLVYLMWGGNDRKKFIGTQIMYIVLSFATMVVFITIAGIVVSNFIAPNALDIPVYLLLNFTVLLIAISMSSIVFFFSCLFNSTQVAAGMGSLILVMSLIFTLIGKLGHGIGVYGLVANASIFRFLRSPEIVSGQVNILVNSMLLIGIAICFFYGGYYIFKRKDLLI